METMLQLPKEVRAAEVRSNSFDEASNSIEVVFTAGATVRRYSWMDGPYDEELVVSANAVRLDRLNAGAPFLNTHSSWDLGSVIGSVIPGSAKIVGGEGVARVKLSSAAGDAEIVQKIRDGIIRATSVGYQRHRIEKIESDDGTVPIWRVTDWEPFEISAVPVPADPAAHIRSAGPGLLPCIMTRRGNEAARARMRIRQRHAELGIR